MDGLEYVSKDVTQHGRTAEVLFNTWDTMFQENKIMKDVEEEQETSTVTLTIMEQIKSGLLGRKTSNVERDSLTLRMIIVLVDGLVMINSRITMDMDII